MPVCISQFVRRLLLILLCLLFPAAAQEIGAVTLVEGSLRMIRGTMLFHAGEGVRLHQGDLLESSSGGFVQLELTGGTVVALGSSTRLLLLGHGTKTTAELVVLTGWLKGETGANAGTYSYASPQLAAATRGGVVVLEASDEQTDLFVESGNASISKVSPQGYLTNPQGATAGQFLTRRGGKNIVVNSRPDQTFLDALPRAFRDTLPPRLSKFPKAVDPKPDHEVTYAEVQPWLTTALSWRRGFVERFQPRLKDAEFRRELEAHIRDYPEWDPVLHPEKYEQKTPSPVASPDQETRR